MSQRYIGGLIYNPPGGFSGYFDGSGDYLSGIGTTSSFNFMHNTTALFTFECWVNLSSTAAPQVLIDNTNGTSGQIGLYIALNAGGTIQLFITRGVANFPTTSVSSTGVVPANTWTHIAVTYDQSLASNNAKFYINGVAAGSGNKTANAPSSANASNAMRIGTYGAGLGDFVNGYISNLRITNSIVYTAAFDPPVGPLQAITNTSLLTCAYPTFRDGSSNNFTITVNGNTAVSVQNPFPLTALPNPNLGNQGNGVYTMSQYQALRSQNLWPAIDPYWEYVTLMLHGNGTNGAQNNTFLDSSTNNFTITRNGNTTQGAFSPYGDNWSNYFDGSGDWLDVASNAVLGYGTGDFTIEFWVFPTSATGTQVYLDQRAGSATSAAPTIYTISGTIYYYVSGSNRITGGTVAANQWSHIALSRSGTSTKLFINGAQTGSTYSDSTNYVTAPVRIGDGNDGAGPYPFPGYISNFRILKGTALYTAAFTPPTAPLTAITNTSLLTCQSNRFIDNSTNNFTITRNGDVGVQRFSPFHPTAPYAAGTIGGSGYFDGSGDYLSVANNTALNPGTGDFTLEAWAYIAGNSPLNGASNRPGNVVVTNPTSGTVTGFALYFNGNNTTTGTGLIFENVVSNTTYSIAYNATIPQGVWHHVAVSRSGTTTKLFLNGAEVASGTLGNQNISTSNAFTIGGGIFVNYENYLNGYISNLRLVKGTAVYTSAFTPPAAPLTAITNTSLLLNFTNGGIIDNAMMNDLETVGNAQISTSVSRFGGGSLAFDGTGDYLFAPSRATTSLEGDFTIEYWIYRSVSGSTSIFTLGDSFTASGIETYIGSSGTAFLLFSGNATRISSSSLPAVGAWSHVAAVRSGSTITLYLNGVSLGTWSSSTTFSGALYVGTEFYNGSVSGSLNGYLDDFRITKYARYTANFTPQRSQWQDQ